LIVLQFAALSNLRPNAQGKLAPQGAQRLEGTEKRSFLASA